MPPGRNRQNSPSAQAFRRRLLAWYDRQKRDLPWRNQPSLYKTVVSEFMLQQTQIETALPYFRRWMQRFPDFAALARADGSAVLKAWEGLGYYSRARNLHALAKRISAEGPPDNMSGWQKLPGIGPYTAAAITSIAFGEALATLDGNVVRVLSRLTANATLFKNSTAATRHFWAEAQSLLDRKRPGDFNQAMMELGATICTPRAPKCGSCPVGSYCAAVTGKNPERYPNIERRKTHQVRINRLWAVYRKRILLQQTASHAKRLADLYELPLIESPREKRRSLQLLTVKRRSISNQRIEERIFGLRDASKVPSEWIEGPHMQWVPLRRLSAIALSGPHRRWANELLRASWQSAPSFH